MKYLPVVVDAQVGFGDFEPEVPHSLHNGGEAGGSKHSSKDLGSVREMVLRVIEGTQAVEGLPDLGDPHEVTVGPYLESPRPRPPDLRCLLQKRVLLGEAAAPPS